jgi:hypothetical protein
MKHLIIAVAVAALLVLNNGCRAKVTGNSVITASAGGREVKATVDGPAWVGPADDKFTVKITGHQIAIEKERLLVDDKELAKIPATATKFDVVCSNGTLRVTADGAEVLATTIGK